MFWPRDRKRSVSRRECAEQWETFPRPEEKRISLRGVHLSATNLAHDTFSAFLDSLWTNVRRWRYRRVYSSVRRMDRFSLRWCIESLRDTNNHRLNLGSIVHRSPVSVRSVHHRSVETNPKETAETDNHLDTTVLWSLLVPRSRFVATSDKDPNI